jgi:hypothetical protein
LYEGARWCPVRPVLATSSFPAKARVAKKGVNRKPQEDKGVLPGQKGCLPSYPMTGVR